VETAIKNQNSILGKIKSILKSVKMCCHSVQHLLLAILLPNYIKIKIYRTIILPVILYDCVTWSLTFRERHRLSTFKSCVLRKILSLRRAGYQGKYYYSGDHIKMKEVGGLCGTYGGQERCIQGFGEET